MRKRLLSALLALAMMLTMLPTAAFAAGTVEQPEGLADYKVIAAGVATTLPEGFPTENAGSGVTETENTERVYVQLNKPVPDGYTITLTVYPANEVKGAYMSSYVAPKDGKGPEGICFSVAKMAKWYWGDQEKGNATTLEEAFGDVKNLYFHVGIAKVNTETSMPDYESTEEGKYVFNPKNSIGKDKGAETADAPALIDIDVKNPYEAPAKPAEPFFTTASDAAFAGKTANNVQTEDADGMKIEKNAEGKYVVTGVTLKEIASWPEFNQSIEAEQSGYYLAIAVPKTIGTGENEKTIASMQLPVEGGTSWKTIEPSAFTENNGAQCDVFIWMGATAKAVKEKSFTIKVKYRDATEFTDCVFDFSQVKVEGEETEEPPVEPEVKPVTVEIGYAAEHEEAEAALGIDREGADKDNSGVWCDDMTMWVKINNAQAGDKYTLEVKEPGGTDLLAEENKKYELTVTDAMAKRGFTRTYFTFDESVKDDPNHAYAGEIKAGEYVVTVTKVGETTPAPITAKLLICKATFNAGEGATNVPGAIYAAAGKSVAIPDVKPQLTGKRFTGWEDSKGAVYLAGDKITLTVETTLGAKWVSDKVKEPAAGEDKVTVPPALEAHKDALENASVNTDAMMTDTAVVKAAEAVAEKLNVENLLAEANKELGENDEQYTKVQVQVYMEIKPTEYVAPKDEEAATLKVDITPMYKVVAVKDGQPADENSPVVDNGGVLKDAANATVGVQIVIALPVGFVEKTENGSYPNVYVTHKGKIQTAPVTEPTPAPIADGDPAPVVPTHLEATFTNTDGFSEFVVSSKNNAAAQIGEGVNVVYYETLQAAVDAVADGGTISLLKDGSAVANEEKTFTITLKGKKATITAASGLKVTPTENKEGDTVTSITYKVEKSGGSTNPGGPGGIGGGSSGSATYSVNVPTAEHGTVTVNPRNAAKDATVTITVAPDKGYHLESLTVTDKDDNKIELTKVDATKYTFKMPASRVEVKAVFAEGEAPAISFTDVAEGEYYYDAVKWAVDKGVTNGLTETTFGPNASCTRAQMVTFLWRAAGSPEPTATTTAFTDIDANEYYYKAVLWAVEKGITTGTTETTFSPSATVTRAQTVTFLYRYAGSPAVSGSNNFTDLEAGEYYINAVQWAATNGITTGTTETTFSPANNCTRGQIVTFLYRHIVK